MSGRHSAEASLKATQRDVTALRTIAWAPVINTNMSLSRPSTSIADDSDENSWTKIPSVGSETIVKLRRGDGPPLIILHGMYSNHLFFRNTAWCPLVQGGGGTIHAFSPLQRDFSASGDSNHSGYSSAYSRSSRAVLLWKNQGNNNAGSGFYKSF